MIYLASPYSHSDKAVQRARYVSACRHAAHWIKEGQHIYSPIAHSVAIAQHGDMAEDWATWKSLDLAMLRMCSLLLVLKLPGWLESVGVHREIDFASTENIEIQYTKEFIR